jgi:hypothetical protein
MEKEIGGERDTHKNVRRFVKNGRKRKNDIKMGLKETGSDNADGYIWLRIDTSAGLL